MKRNRFLICICAFRGHGKTTTLLDFVRDYNERVLIYDRRKDKEWKDVKEISVNEIKDFKGLARITNIDVDLVISEIEKNYRNGLLIFEDAGAYIKPQREDILYDIVSTIRQRGIDVSFSFWALEEVPLTILRFTNYIIVKKTNDNIDNIEKRYKSHPQIITAFNEAKASENKYFSKEVMICDPRF